MTQVRLVAVVALAENGVIGRDNGLPWRQGTDLRRFREITWGKPMIIGRRNWDSIGRALPGRETVVLTRRPDFVAAGAHVSHSWDDAVAAATRLAAELGTEEVIVGGGAEIYRLAMPKLDALRLTLIHASPPGDVVFPPYDRNAFREISRSDHPAGPRDDHPFTFMDLDRSTTEG